MPKHFLHIRKCGGSAIHAALGPFVEKHDLLLHGHRKVLREIDEAEPVFFSVRHPISRFISGFNSRLRKGAPLHDRPWNKEEMEAFLRFTTPDALGLALGGPGSREQAEKAMRGISHVRHTLSQRMNLDDIASHNVLWIGFQETLDADFERLRRLLELPATVRLPEDPILAHRTPQEFSSTLSSAARRNLEDWYADDIALYDTLKACWAA